MVCSDFKYKVFTPEENNQEYIAISVDELEAIRLCDLEQIEQEDAAKRMQISRGTFQRILYSARKKVAEALCEGKGIRIGGGNYIIASRHCKFIPKCKYCKKV